MISVMIVDDHSILRTGLKMLLNAEDDIQVIGESCCGEDALKQLEHLKPQVLILDLTMPGMGGIETLRNCKAKYPKLNVLILTMHDDEKFLPKVLKLGASGYVVKKSVDTVLINAIRIVARGERFIDSTMTEALINPQKKQSNQSQDLHGEFPKDTLLSPREQEVLKYIALGYSNKQIASTLIISIKTVETHKTKIKEKLTMRERSDLVQYAIENELINLNGE